ncbi:MAG: hypothetical protein KJ563_05085 [Candidatus Thermoplasmatota archaeon]|nr:hypothetical protein [Candidatus Thermoplasmatota archaeon]
MRTDDSSRMDRTGLTGEFVKVTERPPRAAAPTTSRKRVASLLALVGTIVLLAVALAPASISTAQPSREVDCTPCHDVQSVGMLSVSGLPATYTPGATYTIFINVTDVNGASEENGFLLTLSGGGTLLNPGPNVEVNNPAAIASTADTRPMTVDTWTVDWTAPSSGAVTIHVWAVSTTDTETGAGAPYDDQIINIDSTLIPEFTTLMLPVLGLVGVVVVLAKISKKSK